MRQSYMLKRIDPWSVLKFAALSSVVVFFILTLAVGFVWYILTSFDLINRGCDVALDVGFSNCDITAPVVFRATALVAGLIAVVHTAVLVFGAFLYNLIAELTGGIGVQLDVESENAMTAGAPTKGSRSAKKSAVRAEPPSDPARSRTTDTAAPSQATPAQHTPANPAVNPPPARPAPPTNPSSGMQRDELFD